MAIDNQTKIDYFKEPLAGKTAEEAFKTKLTGILESHEENINQNISSIANLESSVSGLESSVSGLESSVSGLESSVSGLESIKIEKSIFTALNDFIVGTGVGTYVKKTPSEIRTILNVEEGATKEPTGSIAFITHTTLPYGYLKANGAAISRTTYANLFALIGTTFGVGDGSTTFNLPDLRGYFLRGWDDGRGVDSGRTLGSTQQDQFQEHDHNEGLGAKVLTQSGASGPTVIGMAPINITSFTGPIQLTQGVASGRSGTETRPKNIALMAIIKY